MAYSFSHQQDTGHRLDPAEILEERQGDLPAHVRKRRV